MENGLVNLAAIVGLIVGACGLVPVLFFLGKPKPPPGQEAEKAE